MMILNIKKQYPTQLTLDPEIYKKMQKNIRQWLDRMEDLKKNSTAPPGLCLDPFPLIEEQLPTLELASELSIPTMP